MQDHMCELLLLFSSQLNQLSPPHSGSEIGNIINFLCRYYFLILTKKNYTRWYRKKKRFLWLGSNLMAEGVFLAEHRVLEVVVLGRGLRRRRRAVEIQIHDGGHDLPLHL